MARWNVGHRNDASSTGASLALLTAGLLAGVAAGAYLAHRFGGVSGISARVRRRMRTHGADGAARPRVPAHERTESPVIDEGYEEYGNGGQEDDEFELTSTAELEAAEMEAALEDEMDEDDLSDGDRFDEDASADADGESFASADPELEDRVLTAFTNDP